MSLIMSTWSVSHVRASSIWTQCACVGAWSASFSRRLGSCRGVQPAPSACPARVCHGHGSAEHGWSACPRYRCAFLLGAYGRRRRDRLATALRIGSRGLGDPRDGLAAAGAAPHQVALRGRGPQGDQGARPGGQRGVWRRPGSLSSSRHSRRRSCKSNSSNRSFSGWQLRRRRQRLWRKGAAGPSSRHYRRSLICRKSLWAKHVGLPPNALPEPGAYVRLPPNALPEPPAALTVICGGRLQRGVQPARSRICAVHVRRDGMTNGANARASVHGAWCARRTPPVARDCACPRGPVCL